MPKAAKKGKAKPKKGKKAPKASKSSKSPKASKSAKASKSTKAKKDSKSTAAAKATTATEEPTASKEPKGEKEKKDKIIPAGKEAPDEASHEAPIKETDIIPPIHNYTINLLSLHDHEEMMLKRVMDMDDEFSRIIDAKVSVLRREIMIIRKKALMRQNRKKSIFLRLRCIRCWNHFNVLRYSLTLFDYRDRCQTCRFRVCGRCRHNQANGKTMCLLCVRYREIEHLTGEWVNMGCNKLTGTELMRISLKDKAYYVSLKRIRQKKKAIRDAKAAAEYVRPKKKKKRHKHRKGKDKKGKWDRHRPKDKGKSKSHRGVKKKSSKHKSKKKGRKSKNKSKNAAHKAKRNVNVSYATERSQVNDSVRESVAEMNVCDGDIDLDGKAGQVAALYDVSGQRRVHKRVDVKTSATRKRTRSTEQHLRWQDQRNDSSSRAENTQGAHGDSAVADVCSSVSRLETKTSGRHKDRINTPSSLTTKDMSSGDHHHHHHHQQHHHHRHHRHHRHHHQTSKTHADHSSSKSKRVTPSIREATKLRLKAPYAFSVDYTLNENKDVRNITNDDLKMDAKNYQKMASLWSAVSSCFNEGELSRSRISMSDRPATDGAASSQIMDHIEHTVTLSSEKNYQNENSKADYAEIKTVIFRQQVIKYQSCVPDVTSIDVAGDKTGASTVDTFSSEREGKQPEWRTSIRENTRAVGRMISNDAAGSAVSDNAKLEAGSAVSNDAKLAAGSAVSNDPKLAAGSAFSNNDKLEAGSAVSNNAKRATWTFFGRNEKKRAAGRTADNENKHAAGRTAGNESKLTAGRTAGDENKHAAGRTAGNEIKHAAGRTAGNEIKLAAGRTAGNEIKHAAGRTAGNEIKLVAGRTTGSVKRRVIGRVVRNQNNRTVGIVVKNEYNRSVGMTTSVENECKIVGITEKMMVVYEKCEGKSNEINLPLLHEEGEELQTVATCIGDQALAVTMDASSECPDLPRRKGLVSAVRDSKVMRRVKCLITNVVDYNTSSVPTIRKVVKRDLNENYRVNKVAVSQHTSLHSSSRRQSPANPPKSSKTSEKEKNSAEKQNQVKSYSKPKLSLSELVKIKINESRENQNDQQALGSNIKLEGDHKEVQSEGSQVQLPPQDEQEQTQTDLSKANQESQTDKRSRFSSIFCPFCSFSIEYGYK